MTGLLLTLYIDIWNKKNKYFPTNSMEIFNILTSLQVPVATSKLEVRWHIFTEDTILGVTGFVFNSNVW